MQQSSPLINYFKKYFAQAELIALGVLVGGVGLAYFGFNSSLQVIGFLALAMVYFLQAFQAIELKLEPEEKLGFSQLFIFSIAPKVFWINCAVSLIGLMFYQLNFAQQGYQKMLLVAALGLTVCFVVFLPMVLRQVSNSEKLAPLFYRGLPLLVLDVYFLFS